MVCILCHYIFYGRHYLFMFCNYYTCRKGVGTMKEFLIIIICIIGFAASICVLFYPQETVRQKAVKIGCYLGDIAAITFAVEIIQKYFS